MGARLLEIVKQVGIFMICAQMILHFKPAESYGKYIRLLMSTMVLVQLIVPVFGLLKEKGQEAFGDRVFFYDEVLEDNMENISRTGAMAEEMLERMTLEEVRSRLEAAVVEAEGQPADDQQENSAKADSLQGNGIQTDGLQWNSETTASPQPPQAAIQIDRIEVKGDE